MAYNNAQQPNGSNSYAARVVHSEQARMDPTNLHRFGLIAQPVEETPLERFMTVNGAEEPNNVYARAEMEAMGIGLGDERSVQTRQQAAESLAADLSASKETKKKEKKGKKEKKKSRMSST